MRPRVLLIGAAAAVALGAFAVVDRLDRVGAPGKAAVAAPAAAPPAMPVPVVTVTRATVPVALGYAGRTEAIRSIALEAKVSAYVKSQPASDGSDVQAGTLLYGLDPRDFQVALDQAKAQTQRDAATLDYQKANFQRGDSLSKSGWLAKDNLDERTSSLHQAEAALASSQAALRGAQLNLDYTDIHAPFAGRLGRNQASVGTLVGAGGTVLNTLVQLDPIYVTFNPSETDLQAIDEARRGGPLAATIAVPGQTDAQGHKGQLTFIDNAVDRNTGTLVARATIANADFALLPGQYVRVSLHLRDEADALLVPQAAIGSSQLGKFVFVVGSDEKAEQRLVTLGEPFGDKVVVRKGVSAGDRVITGNLQKIGPGSPVSPQADGSRS